MKEELKKRTLTFHEFELTYTLSVVGEYPDEGEYGRKKLNSRMDVKNVSSSAALFTLEGYLLQEMGGRTLTQLGVFVKEFAEGETVPVFDIDVMVDANEIGKFRNVEIEIRFYSGSIPETGAIDTAVSISPFPQKEARRMITGYIPGYARSGTDDRRGAGLVLHSDSGYTLVLDSFDGTEPSRKLIQYLKDHGYKEINEYLSHPHYDHYKGFRMINNDSYFKVRTFMCYDPESIAHGIGNSSNGRAIKEDYNNFKAVISEAKKKGAEIKYLKSGDKIALGDITFEVWRKQPTKFTENDGGKGYAFINDGSFCTLFRDFCFLTTGDGPEELKEALAFFNALVILYDVSHHGNNCSQSNAQALKKAGCKLAYQTNNEMNGAGTTGFTQYGSKRVKEQGIPVLQLDKDITFTVAVGKLTVKQGANTWVFTVPYNGKLSKGWYSEGGKWYYIDENGEKVTGWKQLGWSKGTSWFLFGPDGYMKTGWNKVGDIWYYLDPTDGYMWINKWINTNGYWYVVDGYGRMRTGWYEDPGLGLRYLEPVSGKNQGHMYIKCTVEIDGKTYTFDGYGVPQEKTPKGIEQPVIHQNSNFTGRNTNIRTGKIEYLVIHYVGAEGTAKDNVNYFNTGDRNASADFFINHDGEIWQYNTNLTGRYSWHCGGGKQSSSGGSYYGKCTNGNSISIEMCTHQLSNGNWTFTELTLDAAARIAAWLLQEYAIPFDNLIRHFDVTGKNCPGVGGWGYIGGDIEWNKWKARVKSIGSNDDTTATTTPKTDNEKFIDTIGAMAQADMKKTGILASLTMAQAILESGWGKSELAVNAKNLFGMKCNLSGNTWSGSTWDGKSAYNKSTGEVYNGSYVTVKADFRVYKSWAESVGDHSAYLSGAMNGSKKRYEGLIGCTDYKKAAQIVKSGGYATSTDYVSKLVNLIETYKLYSYDGVKVDTGTTTAPATTTQKGWNELMPELKRGSTGKAVKMLQAFLGGLTIDGDFGAKTENAVKTYQKNNGLSQDGVVGPKTWDKIIRSL